MTRKQRGEKQNKKRIIDHNHSVKKIGKCKQYYKAAENKNEKQLGVAFLIVPGEPLTGSNEAATEHHPARVMTAWKIELDMQKLNGQMKQEKNCVITDSIHFSFHLVS